MLWHGGGTFGETSQMVLYPDEQIGFVLLANDTCEGSESALKAMAMAMRHAIVSARSKPVSRAKHRSADAKRRQR